MSSKRMLGIAVFGAAFIALFIGAILLTSYFGRNPGDIILPDTETSAPPGGETDNAARLGLVEVTRDNVQAVIEKTLMRPESYAREISIESFWDGSSAVYTIETAVSIGVTALKTSVGGIVKRVIVTPGRLYVWNEGDAKPRERRYGPSDDFRREADEWQMLLTYEDVLSLPPSAIIDAGYGGYGGEECIVVTCKSGRLGYTSRYYISIALGLLIGVEEYGDDSPDAPLTYKMAAGVCTLGEPDDSAFLLPDGDDARTVS